MPVLVVAEHDGRTVSQSSLQTINASSSLGSETHVLLLGDGAEASASHAARVIGVSKVIWIDDPQLAVGMAEDIGLTVCGVLNEQAIYSHILTAATSFGKNFLPRVAALNDVAQISEIIEVVDAETFKRAIYAGSVITTITSTDALKVISVQATQFEVPGFRDERCEVIRADRCGTACENKLIARVMATSSRPELTSADIVVSGGRGLGSAENFDALLTPLADKLNAAVGASRSAVDAGYVSNDLQVGQTGKIVAPRLYFAVGISGAVQHLAGMKDSKIIVGINHDPDAPIFSVADYGIVGDLFKIVPELVALLDAKPLEACP